MSKDQQADGGTLTDVELVALEADLALLMREVQAPALSAALSARILADAAEAAPKPLASPLPAAVRAKARNSLGSWFTALWQPMSAGLAAAAFGVWIGWSDPAGVSLYAEAIITADLGGVLSGELSGGFGNDVDSALGGETAGSADFFELEL